MDVMDQGRMAILGDRAGVPFGIWQPERNSGLDVVTVPGSLCWLELYTPDLPAAAGFYNSVFGWETSAITFDEGSCTCVNPTTDMAGVGRFAKLADPYGARFAVIRSESPQG